MLSSQRRAAGDQLLGGRPVQTHVALCGVHGFGDAHPVAEQMTPKRQGGLPVNGGGRAWDVLTAWVGHDVRRGEGDPALESLRMLRPGPWFGELDLTPATAGFW